MVKTLLRTYGTSACLVCGNRLRFDETRYCAECIKLRGKMISRLENDDDLLRTVFICSRKGAPIPKALFAVRMSTKKEVAQAVNVRLGPLLNFLAMAYLKDKVGPSVLGALWVDISEDLIALYRDDEKHTDIWKTDQYNNRMIPALGKMFRVSEPVIGLDSFRKLRDKGYDLLFPKGGG